MTDYDLCASRRASQGEKHRQNADGHHAGKMNARVTMIIFGAAVASADDIRTPHYHSGVFRRYTPVHPNRLALNSRRPRSSAWSNLQSQKERSSSCL